MIEEDEHGGEEDGSPNVAPPCPSSTRLAGAGEDFAGPSQRPSVLLVGHAEGNRVVGMKDEAAVLGEGDLAEQFLLQSRGAARSSLKQS